MYPGEEKSVTLKIDSHVYLGARREVGETSPVIVLTEQLSLEQMVHHRCVPNPRCLHCTLLEIILMLIKTWAGTNPTQMQSEGHLTSILDSLIPHSSGSTHATWHFSESTHRSSPPTVVKSDNPIITTILNGLFRSEVSQATVCTASPSALTRLCRFMQMRSNPRNAGDSGVFKSVSWPFLCHGSWGGRGVVVNERGSPSR